MRAVEMSWFGAARPINSGGGPASAGLELTSSTGALAQADKVNAAARVSVIVLIISCPILNSRPRKFFIYKPM